MESPDDPKGVAFMFTGMNDAESLPAISASSFLALLNFEWVKQHAD
jgi:hypothetical protein